VRKPGGGSQGGCCPRYLTAWRRRITGDLHVLPSHKIRLNRMSACRLDLADNGINPDAMGPRALCDLARRNLEYFQSMLGYDAGLREVVALMRSTRGSVRFRSAPAGVGVSP
jgi:hypothetical protein